MQGNQYPQRNQNGVEFIHCHYKICHQSKHIQSLLPPPTPPLPHFLSGLAGIRAYCYVWILINIPLQRSLSLKKAERKQGSASFLLQTTCKNFMLAPSSVRNLYLPDSTCTQVHLYSISIYSHLSCKLASAWSGH